MRQCDFCSATPVVKSYSANDFSTLVGISEGAWDACDVCALLIDTEQWDALAAHSVEQFILNHSPTFPLTPEMIRELTVKLHKDFRANRIKK